MFDRPSPGRAVLDAVSTETLLDDLLAGPPDGWSAMVLESVETTGLTAAEREKYFQAWDRQLAWTQAMRAEAMAALAGPDPNLPVAVPVPGPRAGEREFDEVGDTGVERVAFVSGMTLAAAGYEVEAARALSSHLWHLRCWLRRGRIPWRLVLDFVRETRHLDLDAQVAIEERLFEAEPPDVVDHRAWRRRLQRERQKADTDSDKRRKRAKAERSVVMYPLPDGMAVVEATLPAHQAITTMRALTAAADGLGPDDPRTMDQRRADVFAETFAAMLADPMLPRRQGRPACVQVTGGLATLLGLANNPAELKGYGPISAEYFRELAADGEWRRFLTAPGTGALIEVGTRKYRPSQALRDLLVGRHPECSFPGCAVPAERCDIDHAVAFADGGATDARNCGPPCRRHHRCKTHERWRLQRHDDGSATWTSPGGFVRVVEPYRLAGDDDDP